MYETGRHPTGEGFIGTTRDMWEHAQEVIVRNLNSTGGNHVMDYRATQRPLSEEEVRLNYRESLDRAQVPLLRINFTRDEGLKVGPATAPKR
jgi:hypothetical protein